MLMNTMSFGNVRAVEISRAAPIPLRNLLAHFSSEILRVADYD
jgi:hypothetical protein